MTHPSPEHVKAEHALRTERAKGLFVSGRSNGTRASVVVRCGSCRTPVRAEGEDGDALADALLESDCPVCGGEMALERRSAR